MKINVKWIAVIFMVAAMLVLPAMADTLVERTIDPGMWGGTGYVYQENPLDINIVGGAPDITVQSAVPDIYVNPTPINVDNHNTNVNFNINDLDQSQRQNQNQNQFQFQFQDQQQKQKQDQNQQQSIYQPITINLPKDVKIDQLDVGDAKLYTRLVYPQEVITFPISGGEVINMISGGPVAVYTLASTARDESVAIESTETIPTYDPIYHKMVFGMISPLDKVNYYTTKTTMVASSGAAYFVVDNRGTSRPAPGFTMIEVTTIPCKDCTPVIPSVTPRAIIGESSPYPTDENGRAITS